MTPARLAGLFGIGLFSLTAAAQTADAPAGTELTSDTLEVQPGARIALARGSVRVRTPTADVRCAEATATYGAATGDGLGSGRRIERLELRGDVRLERSDGLTAQAAEATFDEATGLLVLTGAPELQRGRDRLEGKRIAIGTRDDSLEVDEVRLSAPRGRPARRGELRAGRMTMGPGGRLARFERDVRLTDGTLSARADRMAATLVPEAPGRPGDVSAVTLTGGVVATRGPQRAEAAEARWDAASGELVLTGRPWLAEGRDVVHGNRIVFAPGTGAARVEAAVARVRSAP